MMKCAFLGVFFVRKFDFDFWDTKSGIPNFNFP